MSDTQMKNGKTLDDKSVLLVVEFRKLGNSRKVNMATVQVNADKSMLHMNKNLFASPEYDAIKTHDGKTRQWLYSRALPSLFKEGVFRVPNVMVVDVDNYLAMRARERAELVDSFKRSYAMRVKEAKERLNGLFRERDYYTADEAASKFGLTWSYVTFDTPDALKNLKAGLFEREREKIVKMVEEANEEIRSVLRLQLSELVKRMITQLTPKSDGKRKKIYDSLTGNVDDFLSTFDARNIADDDELQALVKKARGVLHNVDADDLRNEDFVRITVKDGFDKINKQLDEMIVTKPARRFDFAE
jgi:vacuolar-type H+-ATPase subunit H